MTGPGDGGPCSQSRRGPPVDELTDLTTQALPRVPSSTALKMRRSYLPKLSKNTQASLPSRVYFQGQCNRNLLIAGTGFQNVLLHTSTYILECCNGKEVNTGSISLCLPRFYFLSVEHATYSVKKSIFLTYFSINNLLVPKGQVVS